VNGKPHPEPYHRGATLLGVEPHQCIAVEDSPTGARAAHAAGTRVIAWPEDLELEFPPEIPTIADIGAEVAHILKV
jgi:beta-phosphoglucomutase-like phosphatase (HAD superfamily)